MLRNCILGVVACLTILSQISIQARSINLNPTGLLTGSADGYGNFRHRIRFADIRIDDNTKPLTKRYLYLTNMK